MRVILFRLIVAGVISLLGFAAVCLRIDVGGDYSAAAPGPGLTFDEPFNAAQGVYLARGLSEYGFGIFNLQNAAAVFDGPGHFPDHPPLGRMWIGVIHGLVRNYFPIAEPDRLVSVSAARVATASAFAVLIFAVILFGAHWYGLPAGVFAGFSLMFMPRVFAHAHFASLETFTNLTWTLTVCGIGALWRPQQTTRQRVSFWRIVVPGILFGLALLTKVQAVLLPIPVALWCLWHFRVRAIVPVLAWGTIGVAVFAMLWPWIWFDPFPRFLEYFGRTTDRTTLYTWYFGVRYADADVPWHYPFVLFCVTTPIGILIAGLWGSYRERAAPHTQLLICCGLFPLVLFALPGVTVYDGARLFLIVYPLFTLVSGAGFAQLLSLLSRHGRPAVGLCLTCALMAGQAYGVYAHDPLGLSYYNALVGGLRGANQAGLEPTYWGDCLTRTFWQQVPEESVVYVAPVLHPIQLQAITEQCPVIRERKIELRIFHYDLNRENGLLLLLHRKADLPPWLQTTLENEELEYAVRADGVTLARLIRVTP